MATGNTAMKGLTAFFREKYGLNNQFLFALSVAFEEEGGPLGYLYGRRFTARSSGILFEAIKRDYFGSFAFLDVDRKDDEGIFQQPDMRQGFTVNKKYSENPFAD